MATKDTLPWQYAEDMPPHYSETSHGSAIKTDIKISIAPRPDCNSFQVYERHGSDIHVASESSIAGDIQIKFAARFLSVRHHEELHVSLVGTETSCTNSLDENAATSLGQTSNGIDDSSQDERFLALKEQIWPTSSAPPYSERSLSLETGTNATSMPSVNRFRFKLPPEVCSCVHLGDHRVEYKIIASYQCIVQDEVIKASCEQMIHIVQSDIVQSYDEGHFRPFLHRFDTPVPAMAYLNRLCFMQGSNIAVFFTIPFHSKPARSQLRRVTAELVRYKRLARPANTISDINSADIGSKRAQQGGTDEAQFMKEHIEDASVQRIVLIHSGKSIRMPSDLQEEKNVHEQLALRILLRLPLPRSDELCESHTMTSPSGRLVIDFRLRLGLATISGQKTEVEKEILIFPANSAERDSIEQFPVFPRTRADMEASPFWFTPEDEYDGYSSGVPSSTAAIWNREANSMASESPFRIHRQATELQQDVPVSAEGGRNCQAGTRDTRPLDLEASSDSIEEGSNMVKEGDLVPDHPAQRRDGAGSPPPYPLLEQYSSSGFVTPYEPAEGMSAVLTSAPPYREN